jgi:hypothetical protein
VPLQTIERFVASIVIVAVTVFEAAGIVVSSMSDEEVETAEAPPLLLYFVIEFVEVQLYVPTDSEATFQFADITARVVKRTFLGITQRPCAIVCVLQAVPAERLVVPSLKPFKGITGFCITQRVLVRSYIKVQYIFADMSATARAVPAILTIVFAPRPFTFNVGVVVVLAFTIFTCTSSQSVRDQGTGDRVAVYAVEDPDPSTAKISVLDCDIVPVKFFRGDQSARR